MHPEIITNAGAREGDLLILTKPLGTGIILAGHRMKMTSDEQLEEAISHMMRLNSDGAAVMQRYGVRGATDITGFGLAGHALKLARGSGVTIKLTMGSVPLMTGVYDLVSQGCIPGAAFRNLDYTERDTRFEEGLDYNLKMIAHDAQTSGGLLMAVAPEKAEGLLQELHESGHPDSAVIGRVERRGEAALVLR